MLTITRFRPPDAGEFGDRVQALLLERGQCDGLLDARVVRAVDDPQLFALVSRWEAAGHYRRALSRIEVRMILLPLSLSAMDEPGAYEEVFRLQGDGHIAAGEQDAVEGSWVSARESQEGDWIG